MYTAYLHAEKTSNNSNGSSSIVSRSVTISYADNFEKQGQPKPAQLYNKSNLIVITQQNSK